MALCGHPGSQLVQPDELAQLQQLRRGLLAGGEVGSVGPLRLAPSAGAGRQVRVSASALRDPQGRVVRIVGVVEDVSHLYGVRNETMVTSCSSGPRAARAPQS